jgi:hypothetical protein
LHPAHILLASLRRIVLFKISFALRGGEPRNRGPVLAPEPHDNSSCR